MAVFVVILFPLLAAASETNLKTPVCRDAEGSAVKVDETGDWVGEVSLSLSEHKREISKSFSVRDLPRLSVRNEFGNIRILEGDGNTIRFRIIVTGKGVTAKQAREAAESAEVKLNHQGNQVSATTFMRRVDCENCGRQVDYEITVPVNTGLVLENKFGDIRMNRANGPVSVTLEYGHFYANELSEIILSIRHGNSTVNRCRKMQLKSGYSKGKFGEMESLTGEVVQGSVELDRVGEVNLKSGFSSVEIGCLMKSFRAKGFTCGSLTVDKVDERFSEIRVDATFTKVKIALNERHQFRASLYSSFGSIDTGDVVFREKTSGRKDVLVGIAGRMKAPSAVVEVSNSYGSIVLQ
jgi:hypothetical protein